MRLVALAASVADIAAGASCVHRGEYVAAGVFILLALVCFVSTIPVHR